MKFHVPNQLSQSVYKILRRAGYLPIHDRRSGQDSYSRPISGGHYPRFHLYVNETPSQIIFDLHLDQNKNIYDGQTAHNADYDSLEVRNELAAVQQVVMPYLSESKSTTRSPLDLADEKPASKSWLSRLFGK